MTLNKRYKRNIKENLAFYIAATVLTVVSLFMFFIMNIAGSGISAFGKEFMKNHNVEDAEFTVYYSIPPADLKSLEDSYGITIEPQYYKNIEEESYTCRVFSRNTVINTPEITKGRDIAAQDEIIISEGYAVNNNIVLGDSLALNGESYTVSGYFQRPDYLYMLEDINDSYKNDTSFLLTYLSDEEFSAIEDTNVQYAVKYGGADELEFRKEINNKYKVRTYTSAENNLRISMVEEQAQLFIISSYVILLTVPLVTVVLISVITGRRVKSDQKIIGTMSALGYRKREILRHYSLMAVIPGLIGGILSVISLMFSVQTYGEMGLADYEPMHINFTVSPLSAVLAIIVPTILYILASFFAASKLLKKDTVTLLSGNASADAKTKKLWLYKDKKVSKKFGFRSLLTNPGRSFAILLGVFLGAFIMMFGFLTIDCIKGLPESYEKQTGSYKYQYILNTFLPEKDTKEETLIAAAYETDKTQFTLIGANKGIQLLNLNTEEGRADLSKGFYISSLTSTICDIKEGDIFTFRNITTMQEYSVKIQGIIKSDMQNFVISDKQNISEITGIYSGLYNAVISKDKLNIDEKLIATVIDGASIEEQMDNLMNEMGLIIYTLIVIGAIICISAVFVTVNMMVDENRHNISMLKVLGYRNGEIGKMILSTNNIFLPLGSVLGIAVAYIVCVFYFRAFAEMEKMIIPTVINVWSIVLTLVFVSACFFVSVYFARRKADKVDMAESLKDNRE